MNWLRILYLNNKVTILIIRLSLRVALLNITNGDEDGMINSREYSSKDSGTGRLA